MATTFNQESLATEEIAGRFKKLDGDRSTILTTARDCSVLTISSVLPPDGHKEGDVLPTPYQSVGARLVNNLASKLLMTMLPPNSCFFRIMVKDEMKKSLNDQQNTQAEDMIILVEKEAQKLVEQQAIRVVTYELIKSLIITGNALGVKIKDKGLKSYSLDNYVILRDYRGNPVEIITREMVSPDTLDMALQEQLNIQDQVDKDVTVYTRAVLRDQMWYEYQYVDNVFVEGSIVSYKEDKFPYIPLRWTSIGGHNYGVSLVEQYLGDFRSLEACYQLLIEFAAVAGRTVFGLKPGSITDIDDLNGAENGQVISGDLENDLTVMVTNKGNDISYIQQIAAEIQRRLEQAFLAASSAARDSERTTKYEVAYMARDLEQSLGGVYSVLSQEYQSKTAKLIIDELKVDTKNSFDYVIVTGIDALGRNSDLERLMQFSQVLQQSGLGDTIAQRLNLDNYINDLTVACSLPVNRYIKTAEQLQAEQQAMQQQQMIGASGQALAQSVGQGAGSALTGQQQ